MRTLLPSTKPPLRLTHLGVRIPRKWGKYLSFQLHYANNLSSHVFDDYIATYEEPPPKAEPKPLSWYASKRKAARLLRTPKWVDQEAIAAIYRECYRLTRKTGIEHHVDHILPLQGRHVSGLHVAENLQVISAIDNMRKGNHFDVDA